MKISYHPSSEFQKVRQAPIETNTKLELIASMCRLNTLFAVKKGGSGHLGSSFSAMDIVVYLYEEYLNVIDLGFNHDDRDIYFSSKGHDVPGFYSVLYSHGKIPDETFMKLRRLGGLDGHPDVKIPGVEANTGSLGMGISKGKGMIFAKRLNRQKGRVFVMVGDGEMQEGQNFEAMQSAVQQDMGQLTVVMDHNKLQSDRLINRIVDLGDIETKYRSFGWHVSRCNGNDFNELRNSFQALEKINDRPKFLICDTIKGRGVSFMEHPRALEENGGYYRWHAGAPNDDAYQRASEELIQKISNLHKQVQLNEPLLTEVDAPIKGTSGVSDEVLKAIYGRELVEQAKNKKSFVVLDADLSLDCDLRDFEDQYPERFFECGIAEQDMVSAAAGIASQGLLPLVHSFSSFLCSRANEQIYNALTENRKIIFSAHFGGLIPAAPGKSHQSIRDISLFSAFPNCSIIQVCCESEMVQAVGYLINQSEESVMIRINVGPSPRRIQLPDSYQFELGKGVVLHAGDENVLFAYGPVMLHEALGAAQLLREKGISLKVINQPWLNRFDQTWLNQELEGCKRLFVLDDHSIHGGLGDLLIAELSTHKLCPGTQFTKFGVEGFPVCGSPKEALRYHQLDAQSLADRIYKSL